MDFQTYEEDVLRTLASDNGNSRMLDGESAAVLVAALKAFTALGKVLGGFEKIAWQRGEALQPYNLIGLKYSLMNASTQLAADLTNIQYEAPELRKRAVAPRFSNWDLLQGAIGGASEAAEVVDLVAGMLQPGEAGDNAYYELNLDKLEEEVGDKWWYDVVALLSIKRNMASCATRNVNKRARRYATKHTVEESKARRDEAN